MSFRYTFLALAGLFLFIPAAFADAPLKSALGLTIEQARQVDEIQAKHRLQFASKRTERNTELRKLRRARLANDSKTIAEQEAITDKLLDQLRAIRASEDDAIRKLLNPEQEKKFEDYIKQRKEMVGSSRDAAEL
ncbi:MAG: hypothetical protein KIT83_11200 [Bryobacterales bacterium]|nr:hypothetical protein [Bryobacterales bacterium]